MAGAVNFWELSTSKWRRGNRGLSVSGGITINRITIVQRWVKARVGAAPALVLEWAGDRNRVLLRLERDGFRVVAEVGLLYALRSKNPKAAPEAVLSMFRVSE